MIALNKPETHESDNSDDSKREENPACQGCPQAHACRDVWSQPRRGPFSAMGLSLGSIIAFLLPWLCAIASMVAVRLWTEDDSDASAAQLLAALAGLVVGAGIAYLIMPIIRKRFHRDSEEGK